MRNKNDNVTLIVQLHTLQNTEPPQSISINLTQKIFIIATRLLYRK